MTKPLLLLSLLSLAPVVCFAQPRPNRVAPQISVEPSAKTLLDQATATYKAASGVRFDLTVNEKTGATIQTRSQVSFQKPNLLRVKNSSPTNTERNFSLVSDGKARFTVRGKIFERQELPKETRMIWREVLNNGTGFLMAGMLEGRSPVNEMAESLQGAPFPAPSMTVVSPPPTLIEGDVLRGVKFTLSSGAPKKLADKGSFEATLWFGSDGLLRRISTRDISETGRLALSTETLSAQQLNPTFAADTFKFNESGLQPAATDTPIAHNTLRKEVDYFDPRLKVGTRPFAFSAKALNGAMISPARYKGKVLLLDFWATWCGPCVASLPDLQAAYKKHHKQGLEVVGISLDEDKTALTSFIKTNKMPWPQVFDGKGWKSRVPGIYGVRAIPFFLIIGKDGQIAAVNPRDDLEGAVKRALAAS